jgi:hypothetical protein
MRWLGYGLATLAVAALAGAGFALAAGGPRLGEVWFALDPFSLNLVQAVIQRYLHPALWDQVAVPVLLSSAVTVALVGAALFALLAWLVGARR